MTNKLFLQGTRRKQGTRPQSWIFGVLLLIVTILNIVVTTEILTLDPSVVLDARYLSLGAVLGGVIQLLRPKSSLEVAVYYVLLTVSLIAAWLCVFAISYRITGSDQAIADVAARLGFFRWAILGVFILVSPVLMSVRVYRFLKSELST